MRARDVTYGLNPAGPAGLLELRRQLKSGGAGAPPETLGPVTALAELKAVCASMLEGRGGPNRSNRPSLVADLGAALGALGDQTKQAAGPALTKFIRELGQVPQRLDRPQGARVLSLALVPLHERLADAAVLRSAWRDTVATFLDTKTSAEECELRMLQLAELAELRGVDWEQRTSTLECILSDHAGALAQVGAIDAPPNGDELRRAGLAPDERIELCEERLPPPATRSAVAVWLVVDGAAIEDGYLKVGPIELFYSSLVPDALAPGGALEKDRPVFESPPELRTWDDVAARFENLPPAEHRLYARVWIKDAPIGEARQRARTALQSMIDVANAESQWVLFDGAASWREDGGWSGSSFVHPEESRRRPIHAVFDRTAEGLTDLVDRFVERLLAGDRVAEEAISDALWTMSVVRAPTRAQRVVLGIRAIERTLSHARTAQEESWTVPAHRFLRAAWVNHALDYELLDAGYASLAVPDRHYTDRPVYDRVHDAVFPPTGPGIRTFDVRGLAAEAKLALEHLPTGTTEHRLVRSASALLTSPEAALARLVELGARFDRLLARAERERNAITHGTTTVEPVLATIDEFVVILARLVAQEAMRQAETGKEPLSEFEHTRIEALNRQAALEAGSSPLDVLFPGSGE